MCIHTCKETICINEASKTVLWRSEGNSCSRHIRTTGVHPNCTTDCPGFTHLNNRDSHGNVAMEPTRQQLQDCIPRIRGLGWITDPQIAYLLGLGSVRELDAIYPTREMAEATMEPVVGPSATGIQTVARGEAADPPSNPSNIPRRFTILYVPDPSRACTQLSHTHSDLSYTTQTMLKEDFRHLKTTLPGYIFAKRCHPTEPCTEGYTTVRISEWVSHAPCIYSLLLRAHRPLAMDHI